MRTKLQSVQNGFEYDLSKEQVEVINELMKSEGKYHPSVQGKRYGYLSFDMPHSGYFSFIDENAFKALKRIAGKSRTIVYISNTLPEDIREAHKPAIIFTATHD
jgi:hypothetical protein